MKLLLLITLLVCSNAQINYKYPKGTYISSCSNIEIDGNKMCAFANYIGGVLHKHTYKNWNCIIFDECSYIENAEGKLVDNRLSNCNTNNKISILEKKLDLIIKYINLELGTKYKGLEDFSL
jgi:hypothetical protein